MYTYQDSGGICHILENEVGDLKNWSEHQKDCEQWLHLQYLDRHELSEQKPLVQQFSCHQPYVFNSIDTNDIGDVK